MDITNEMNYKQLINELDDFNTIENLLKHWKKIVGGFVDEKKFYHSCLHLTEEELLEARTNLIIHGKTTDDFELYISKFAKGYYFVGRFFKPKTYKSPLIFKEVNLGFPIYFDWCRYHKYLHPPEKTGIYHLFLDGVLIYIGFSRNIRNRLESHYFDNEKPFDAVLWFTDIDISIRDWLRFEKNCIQYWKPTLNKNYLEK